MENVIRGPILVRSTRLILRPYIFNVNEFVIRISILQHKSVFFILFLFVGGVITRVCLGSLVF